MNYSVLTTFQNVHEVYVAASLLNSEGIETKILNENSGQAFGILIDQLGGFRLEVPTEKLSEAKELLLGEGIISPSDEKEYSYLQRIAIVFQSWPLLGRLPAVYILLFLVTLLAGIGLSTLAIMTTGQSETMSEWEMEYSLLPVIDTMLNSNPKLALVNINKLQKNYPDNSELWSSKGVAYYNMDSLDNSYNSFLKSQEFRKYPDVNIIYNLGLIKLNQNKFDEAITHFEEGLEIDSSFLHDIAYTYESKGDINNAIRSYSDYVKLYVENGVVTGNLEDYKFIIGQIDSLKNIRNGN